MISDIEDQRTVSLTYEGIYWWQIEQIILFREIFYHIFSAPLRSYLLPFNKQFPSRLCVILFPRLLLINSTHPSPVFHCSLQGISHRESFLEIRECCSRKKSIRDRDYMCGAICNGATTGSPTRTARASTYLAPTLFGHGNSAHLLKSRYF
ncbi:hypothetical protein CEXT_428271 [Caerostris extrusa]|uniref:Uncharacterized protein n=1 Tax=Caerostris extrusa TaxID=172846 RepID=A0AAV4X6I4_CAEEX|nr:hypothetical protein CEXT_428271 [Caerostris extrusa]